MKLGTGGGGGLLYTNQRVSSDSWRERVEMLPKATSRGKSYKDTRSKRSPPRKGRPDPVGGAGLGFSGQSWGTEADRDTGGLEQDTST